MASPYKRHEEAKANENHDCSKQQHSNAAAATGVAGLTDAGAT